MTTDERQALLDLWRDVPDTKPRITANIGTESASLHWSDTTRRWEFGLTRGTPCHFRDAVVAALARDAITMHLIGEGWHDFEWGYNSDTGLVTLENYTMKSTGKTALLCLIAAARSVKGIP